MGKSKKDKRSKRDVDSDSEGDGLALEAGKNEPAVNDEISASATDSKPNKKKKKTKGKKGNDDDSGDELDILAKVVAQDTDDRPKPAKKAKPKMSAFQMLEMLGSENSEDDEKDEDSPEKVQVVVKPKKANKEKKIKKDTEEEDLDAVLASFNANDEAETRAQNDDSDDEMNNASQPVKKSKDKKKKKKQKEEKVEEPEDDDIDALLASIAYTEDPNAGLAVEDAVDVVAEQLDSVTVKDNEEEADDIAEGGDGTVKTKAQKKKEKRDKDRQKKKELKKGGETKVEKDEESPKDSPRLETEDPGQEPKEPSPEADGEDGEETSSKKKKDKKKKKTKEEKEQEERAKHKPGRSKIKAMQEALAQLKEQEERLEREEEEAEKRAEDARREKEEAERVEQEKKEKAKQKKKERELRLKQEGKWLTDKQKADRRRALQMLEMYKQQGIEVPQKTEEQASEKKKRVVYEKKKKRPQQQQQQQQPEEQLENRSEPSSAPESPAVTSNEAVAFPKEEAEFEPEVQEEAEKDDWDADSDDEKATATAATAATAAGVAKVAGVANVATKTKPPVEEAAVVEEEEDDEEESEEEESSDEEEEESSSSEDDIPYAEKVRIRAQERLQKRFEDNEKARTVDVLRSPVVCVLGHVDTGKTKILDKLRRTHVQDGEAGGITQQIGATNVPVSAIKKQTEMCKEFSKIDLRLPGLLIIDTPGHESFSNLRSRGSSLCDIAILVVDIMHGLEPQTLESIQLLKKRKTPFVVALNKVDRLFQWKTNPGADVLNTLKKQQKHTKDEYDDRVKNIVLEFANQSLNVTPFYENKNPKEWISMIPTSAHSGDGMGNLMATICELCQTMLAKRLSYSNELQATVMEVKALPGLGTTIDVCLVNGKLREGQTIVVAGQEGPIVTQIRGLLIPPPMKELRVKNQYEKVKEMRAAHGVKIIAKDLEKALAGLPMYACFHQDEVEIIREEVANQLKNALNAIKLTERGVFVQASTLGSMEALLEFLKTSKIPYAGINIGPVHKKDVMRASVMLEHDIQYAVILAFDVKVEREAQELADSLGVRIFTADIIYHLFDRFMEYREKYKQKKKEEFRSIAVFPCRMRILPQYIFNSRDPIVMGVSVEAGVIRHGTPICVPTKEFVELGRITSLEINNKTIESARKGQDVCIKIDPIPGDAPKMFGRHFEAEDMLVSSVSRESIDAVKEYFRDEMQKTDWQLMIELKKIFKIS